MKKNTKISNKMKNLIDYPSKKKEKYTKNQEQYSRD